MRILIISGILFLGISLPAQDNLLPEILIGKSPLVDQVLEDADAFEVQLIYTRIDRNNQQEPIFNNYKFGCDPNRYFYPASTVKMPVAALALERINELGIIGLDKHSKMITGKKRDVQKEILTDPSARDSTPSIGQYIKKIFLYSDNEAYNRLFEFLGAAVINKSLAQKGIPNTRIIHRVGAPGYNSEENCYLNPISFFNGDSLLFFRDLAYSRHLSNLNLTGELKGVGFMKNGVLVNEKMEFRNKNFLSLDALLEILKRIIFPKSYTSEQRFLLTKKDYDFLLKSMATYPSEEQYPKIEEPDGYVKFFLLGGDQKEVPKELRIFNKVGDAYGYLIDVAYIVDLKNNIEFMLSGVIHVNENKIYNDDTYEYQSIGFPFFKEVGNIIYEYELKRSKSIDCDLSALEALFPK